MVSTRCRATRVALLSLLMGACFLAGGWFAPRLRVSWEPGPLPPAAAQGTPARGAASTVPSPRDEPIAAAVAMAGPSVVNIDTVSRVVRDDFFFGPRAFERSGAGSGVIIDARGHILTNEHVMAGAQQINITFGNGRRYRAVRVGMDHETDVGVLRLVDAPSVPVARLGNSRSLIPGQWAIAIGNPYGFQQTVTLGVVGHTGRAVQVGERVYKRLIQTDAAINPGNSGGALVDIHGNVIGINTAVRADAQGIGFAIPIDLAKSIADELIRSGRIKRPWTGLNVAEVTADVAMYLNLSRAEGALVDQIDRRGPAWRAGIRPGDVIRELGGKRIRTRAEAEAIINAARIGDRLPFVVERDGELLKGELVVAEKP